MLLAHISAGMAHSYSGHTQRPIDHMYLIPASLLQQQRRYHHQAPGDVEITRGVDDDKWTVPLLQRQNTVQPKASLMQTNSTQSSGSRIFFTNPFSIAKNVCKAVLACTFIAWLIKKVRGCSCNMRRFRWFRKFLLATGYDEFEEFRMHVLVHNMKDVETSEGLLSKEKFRVKVLFGSSEFMTGYSENKKWVQSRVMDVKQGVTECLIQVRQKTAAMDKVLAERTLETKDILDKQGFLGTKQAIKLEHNHRNMGAVYITFRVAGKDENANPVIFEGLDNDSALAIKLREIMEEEGFPTDIDPLEGVQKQKLLAKALRGNLKQKDSQQGHKIYAEVKYNSKMQFLPEQERKQLQSKLVANARKAGKGKGKGPPPSEMTPTWYWCQWKSKEAHDRGQFPKSFFPISSIQSVHSDPKQIDEFTIRIKQDDKESERFTFGSMSRDRTIWVDAIEFLKDDLKEIKKDAEQEARKQAEIQRGLQHGWVAHNDYVAQYGNWPENDAEWKNWTHFVASKGIDYKVIHSMREQMETAAQWDSMQESEDAQKYTIED